MMWPIKHFRMIHQQGQWTQSLSPQHSVGHVVRLRLAYALQFIYTIGFTFETFEPIIFMTGIFGGLLRFELLVKHLI